VTAGTAVLRRRRQYVPTGRVPKSQGRVGHEALELRLPARAPGTVVGDRGTAANDQALEDLGVKGVGLQRSGTPGKARLAVERARRFRRLRNWRVGIKARIRHLKRGFGLRRTRLRRLGAARTWVGLGIFAYNLQPMTVVAG
jgi:IS5 family transposase